MKRIRRNTSMMRQKNRKFKSLKQIPDFSKCDSTLSARRDSSRNPTSLRRCQHCVVNENNTPLMRHGPAGAKKRKLRDLSKGQINLSAEQSDLDALIDVNVIEGELPVIQNGQGIPEDPSKTITVEGSNNHTLSPCDEDPLIDVNITVLEGELSVIQNEQGIHEDPSKAIVGERSYNHALHLYDEDPLIDVNITVLDGKLPVIRNEHGISEDPSKAIVGERSYNHALNLCDEDPLIDVKITALEREFPVIQKEQPMKSYSFSEIIATAESLLAFLDKDLPSASEVDYTSSRAKYKRIVLETTTVAGQTVRNDITRRMMDLPVPSQQIIEALLDVLASEVETPSEDFI